MHPRSRQPLYALTATLLLGAAGSASANDGGLAYGGAPRLLDGHPSVQMESEVVRMTVGEEKVTVDCRFVFRNHGPATKVRMGFPDTGEGAENPDQDGSGGPPRGTFTSFRSWVDGQPVRTRLIRGKESGEFWHVKHVTFPARSRRVIRDAYTVPVGGQITEVGAHVHQASYTLHTGSSWRGPIGQSEITVTFDRKRMRAPLRVGRITEATQARVWQRNWSRDRHAVWYRSPATPSVRGKTLTFVRTNWRPRRDDDLYLVFDCEGPYDSRAGASQGSTEPVTSVRPLSRGPVFVQVPQAPASADGEVGASSAAPVFNGVVVPFRYPTPGAEEEVAAAPRITDGPPFRGADETELTDENSTDDIPPGVADDPGSRP